MAFPTYLDLKTMVANQLGKVDQSTYTAKRENLINKARNKFYSERQWSWLFKTTTLTLTPSGNSASCTLPSDYNYKFPPLDVYVYVGYVKFDFVPVEWSDLGFYTQDRFVYSINPATNTLQTNHNDYLTISFDYTYLPADRPADVSQDAQAEPAPQIIAIAYLAIAYWWLASERSTSKYQLFTDLYDKELGSMIAQEERKAPPQFFRPLKSYIQKGYRGNQ